MADDYFEFRCFCGGTTPYDVLTVNTAMSFRTWAVVFMVPMALSQVREDGMFVADFAETWHLYAFIYSE